MDQITCPFNSAHRHDNSGFRYVSDILCTRSDAPFTLDFPISESWWAQRMLGTPSLAPNTSDAHCYVTLRMHQMAIVPGRPTHVMPSCSPLVVGIVPQAGDTKLSDMSAVMATVRIVNVVSDQG